MYKAVTECLLNPTTWRADEGGKGCTHILRPLQQYPKENPPASIRSVYQKPKAPLRLAWIDEH
jgi:hypothetical protein